MERYFFIKELFIKFFTSSVFLVFLLFNVLYFYKLVHITPESLILGNIFITSFLYLSFVFSDSVVNFFSRIFVNIFKYGNFEDLTNKIANSSILKGRSKASIGDFIEKEKQKRLEFCLNIGEELKNYVSSIILVAERGEDSVSSSDREKLSKYYSSVKRLGYKTLSVMENLISDVEASVGIVVLNNNKSYLGICVDNIISELLPMLSEKGLSIHVSGDAVIECCYCDEVKIFKIIFNAIFNSVKSAPENSNIYIAISNTDLDLPNQRKTKGIKFLVESDKDNSLTNDVSGKSSSDITFFDNNKLSLQGDFWLEFSKNIITAHYGFMSFENIEEDKKEVFSFIIPKNKASFETAERTYICN